jgi:hypothetical protein
MAEVTGRQDIQHNDTQHNDTQHNDLIATLSAKLFSIIDLIVTLSIIKLIKTISTIDFIQTVSTITFSIRVKCHHAECRIFLLLC